MGAPVWLAHDSLRATIHDAGTAHVSFGWSRRESGSRRCSYHNRDSGSSANGLHAQEGDKRSTVLLRDGGNDVDERRNGAESVAPRRVAAQAGQVYSARLLVGLAHPSNMSTGTTVEVQRPPASARLPRKRTDTSSATISAVALKYAARDSSVATRPSIAYEHPVNTKPLAYDRSTSTTTG